MGKPQSSPAAARDLGLAIAKELAGEGCDVCICARNEERLAAAKREIQSVSEGVVRAVRCDVSVAEDIAAAVEETVALFGTVHILVSNAGVSTTRDFLDVDARRLGLGSMGSILYAASRVQPSGDPLHAAAEMGPHHHDGLDEQPPAPAPPRGLERLQSGAASTSPNPSRASSCATGFWSTS